MKTHVIFGTVRAAEDWRRRAGLPREAVVIATDPGKLYRATRGLELGRLTFVSVYRAWRISELDVELLREARAAGARFVVAP